MIRLSLIASLWVLLFNSLAQSADRVRIAYSSISAAYTGIWVAREAGFFAKEGLEDQIIFIPSATQLAQVLVAGDVDIASLGGGPVMAASLSGADLKVIGNNVNKLIFSIHAKPEVKSLEDLRGKRIAVSRFGSSADIAARAALRKLNMDPVKDVNLMQLGTMANMFGALKSGGSRLRWSRRRRSFYPKRWASRRSSASRKWISPTPTHRWPFPATSSAKNPT